MSPEYDYKLLHLNLNVGDIMNKNRGTRISFFIYEAKLKKMSDSKLQEFITYMEWQDRFFDVTERKQIIEDLADYMTGLYTKHVVGICPRVKDMNKQVA